MSNAAFADPLTIKETNPANAFEDSSQSSSEKGSVDDGLGIFSPALVKTFNKAAGHIEGNLVPMSQEETLERLNKFNSSLIAHAEAALPEGADDTLRTAMIEYVTALSRTRQKIKPAALKQIAQRSPEEIKSETKETLKELSEVERYVEKYLKEKKPGPVKGLRNVIHKVMHHDESDPADKFFEESERIYFKLEDKSVSSVEPFVKAFLEKAGYEITDYKGGYASNDGGKNKMKIGKILGRTDAPLGLIESFSSDPCRVAKNLMVVLTRNPVDISRGSHERAWKSCRADASSAANNGINEYYEGVVAAYLVTEDDPDIHDPLGRLYLKPFDKTKGKYNDSTYKHDRGHGPTVYFTFNPIGLHFPAFSDAVNRFADKELNGDNYGTFHMRPDCESYREKTERTRLPEDAKAALKQLGVDFSFADEGHIVVDSALDLSSLGLHKLPNFKDIKVNGPVNVSHNKLLSLEGLPQKPVKELIANGTLISSFAGAPEKVENKLSYLFSAYLMSTCGVPEAGSYEYGGRYGARQGDGKVSGRCIGPMEQPDSFLRFKRK